MKNIFKFACLFLAVGMTSCYDTMDDKAVVESGFAQDAAPTVTIGAINVLDYHNFTAEGSVSTTEGVMEVGFQVAADASFTNPQLIPAPELSTAFSTAIVDVKDNQTFYVRSYAYTKGGKIIVSEAQTAALPKAPAFAAPQILGTFTAIDYDTAGNQASDPYTVKIAQKDGYMYNKISITNIWGYGMTIEATMDYENNGFVTKPYSVIYIDSTYGNCWAWGFDIVDGKVKLSEDCTTKATYDADGNITFGWWSAQVEAGSFGRYITKLVKK